MDARRFCRLLRRVFTAGWILAAMMAGPALSQTVDAAKPPSKAAVLELSPAVHQAVNDQMGLLDSTIVSLSLEVAAGEPLSVRVPLDGQHITLTLTPRSVLADCYQLLVQVEGGALMPHEPGPTRTLRGTVLEMPGSVVAASLLDAGLFARIAVRDGEEY